MIEITNGKKTIMVPEATAQATLKQKWLKGWTIIKNQEAPQEVIQFQQTKLKESCEMKSESKPEPKTEQDLFKLPVSTLEGLIDTLTEDQLKNLIQDPRKSVKTLVKRQLNKIRNVGRK